MSRKILRHVKAFILFLLAPPTTLNICTHSTLLLPLSLSVLHLSKNRWTKNLKNKNKRVVQVGCSQDLELGDELEHFVYTATTRSYQVKVVW